MPKTRGAWIGATVFLCLVLAGLAWMLLISPKLDEASGIRAQEDKLITENDVLAVKVATLRDQFSRIDEYRNQVSALQVRMPTELQMEALFDEVNLTAQNAGITLTEVVAVPGLSLADSVPDPAAAPVAPAPAPAPAGAAAAAEAAAATEAAAPADGETPATPIATLPATGWTNDGIDQLVVFPFTVTFQADNAQTQAFLRALQRDTTRYYLVSNPSISIVDREVGQPITGLLDVTVTVQAYVYTDVTAPPVAPAPDAPGPVEPSARDPFGTVAAE